ncbi:MAG: flagellar biosynthetic protein FliQ [bacterium]
MNVEIAIDLLHQLIITAIICIGPFLLLVMIVGIIVSLLQTITSIQEQSLSFVPKLIGCILLLWLLSHWLFRQLMEFTILLLERISDIVK